ncbi:MAG: iron-sulfur cluster assembly accessory protein [Chloroflexi bacterium]|nr:iron-sulfur cluster assembly accessory protein [Chloroflexota bacterium]
MITLTPTAAGKIQSIMKEQGETESALRVIVTGMSCSGPQYMMTLENEKHDDDTEVTSDGLRILLDPDTANVLAGSKIDYLEGLEKSGFTIVNPNLGQQGGGGGGCGGNCACGK